MKTLTIPFESPDSLPESLGLENTEQLAGEFRFLLAVKLFEEGKVSIGRAAQMCGMEKLDFMDELGRRRIPVVNFDREEIAYELRDI